MRISPKQYAVLLYEMTKEVKKSELKEALQSFMKIMMRGRALPMFSRILELYKAYYNTQEDVVDVEVTTAQEISKGVVATLRLPHGDLTTAATFRVDHSMIGGAKIKVGDYMLDDTLKARLKSLKHSLVQ